MLKGQQHELKNFLGVYEHLCAHYRITSSDEKCKGLITYCSPKVGRTVERFPSFIMGDYDQLVEDLEYFQEEEEDTYNVGLMAAFTKKWRKRKMETKKIFKQYHRKYLELVGKALASGHISNEDNNRHFWEGIHRSLRKRIEDRMLVVDPDLDVSTPFDMQKVVKAVGHIYNRHRFDQHLLETSISYSSASESDTEEEDHYKPPKKSTFDSDSEKEESEDSDYSPRKPLHKQKRRHSADRKNITIKKEPLPKQDLVPKKVDNHELSKLAQQMGKLSLVDTRYRALYVDIIREMLDKPQSSAFAQPVMENQYQRSPPRNYNRPRNHENQFQREGPPRNYNPPPNNNPYQRDGPPRQYNLPRNNDNQFQRDFPPHQNLPPPQSYGPSPGQPPMTELYCYGCGTNGHRMQECGELNALLNQRVIIRNDRGKLRWPDGAPIFKDRDEPWAQAINKAMKRSNIVKAEIHYQDSDEDEEDLYVGACAREEEVSSEEQEELYQTFGPARDCYALGVERDPRVSKSSRQPRPFHSPSSTQRVKRVTESRIPAGTRKQDSPVNQGIHFNSKQYGSPKQITHEDVSTERSKGRMNKQLLPMEDIQVSTVEPESEVVKVTPSQDRDFALKATNPTPKSGRSSSGIVQEIMNMPLTVTVEEAVNISPTLRRDLTKASRSTHDTIPQVQEKNEKTVLRACISQPLPQVSECYHLAEPRDDLLKVPARIGQARMTGVYDSGSQINVISDKFIHTCGLPVTTKGIEHYKITGVSGGLAHCIGVIPNATIYITDEEWATVGELVVIKHAGFDLLLGRPWSTMNRAGTSEEDDGTYLSFRSKGEEHSVNISPNSSYSKMDKERPVLEPLSPIKTTCGAATLDYIPTPHKLNCKPEQEVPNTDIPIKKQELQEQDQQECKSEPEIHSPAPSEVHSEAEGLLYLTHRQPQDPPRYEEHSTLTTKVCTVAPEDFQHHPDLDKQDGNQVNNQWPPYDSRVDIGYPEPGPLYGFDQPSPLHRGRYIHDSQDSDEWSNFSTPPTTPEPDDQVSDDIWGPVNNSHQGSMYLHGKSHYHQCDQMRSSGTKEKTCPILSRKEIVEIAKWCDELPEYQQGGYQFLIHQEAAKTIMMTLVGDRFPIKHLQRIGEQVLELSRFDTGELYEVPGSQTASHGRFQRHLQLTNRAPTFAPIIETPVHPHLPEDIHNHHTESPPISSNYPTDLKTEPSTKDPPPNTIYLCFAAILDHDQKPGKEKPTQGDLKEPASAALMNSTDGIIPEGPSEAQVHQEGSNLKIQDEHDLNFPVPKTIWNAPACEKQSNGVLAAQEVISYAQYDNINDHEFFAKGVTLVVDNDEGKPTYFQGNAMIRISQRSTPLEPKSPNRRRVNRLRRQLFKMNKHVKEDQGTEIRHIQPKIPLPDSNAHITPKSQEGAAKPNPGTVDAAKANSLLPFKPSSVFSHYHHRRGKKPSTSTAALRTPLPVKQVPKQTALRSSTCNFHLIAPSS